MHVVATAGHVDHGKSTLVEALTGQQPDRLEEERRRGLSIQLGYCWTTSTRVGEIAFVDVPGHERFLATALSGLGPVPVVLMVVAADDPWMPQAAEHLAALDALGVRHGLLVITRSDLADPTPALARARQELARTSLADVADVAVSARTGQGIDELRRLLDDVLATVPQADAAAPVRLWTDRRFHAHGSGTVVTGTLQAGTISSGDRLETGTGTVRVRGLESLGRPRGSVSGTARVALALAGDLPDNVTRGGVLATPGSFEWVEVLDVRLHAPAGIEGSPRLPERIDLHLGSGSTPVHVRPLGERHARLTLPTPAPCLLGDRGVLRDPGSRALWGIEVLDCAPAPLRRRGSARERATSLESWAGTVADQVRSRGLVGRSFLERIGARASRLEPGTVEAGGWLLSASQAREAQVSLTTLVEQADEQGVAAESAARALGLPVALLPGVVSTPLRIEGGRVRRPSGNGLPPDLRQALDEVRGDLIAAPFAAPDAGRLRTLGLDERAVTALHRRGDLLHVGGSIVLLPDAPEEAVRRLARLDQPFTTSEARQALDTSRRVVLPLLSHLDRTGRTVRLADDRRRVR